MPVVVAVCVLVVSLAFAAAAAARRRLDLRADLLDLLASGCRRGAPLGPLVHALAAQPYRSRRDRRALERTADRLDAGDSLAEALAGLGRKAAPRHVVEAVRAAEGTSRLPAVLEAVAQDTGRSITLRHRLRLASLYPVLLTVFVLGMHLSSIRLYREVAVLSEVRFDAAGFGWASLGFALVLAAGGAVVLVLLLERLGRLPGSRRLGQARVLSVGALLLEAGLPLPQAFARAARGAGSGRLETSAEGATAAIEAGAAPDVLWTALDLTASDRVRLAAAGPRLARVLADTSARCLARWKAGNDVLVRWLKPATVVIVSALVFIDFRLVFLVLQAGLARAREAVVLW